MDILGIRTFARGTWKYFKGTGRESQVALDSIKRLRNAKNDGYVETDPQKILRNARGFAIIFLASGVMLIFAAFYTLQAVQLKLPAITNFIIGLGFVLLGTKSMFDAFTISEKIKRGEHVR
jgi:hypothetical protein